MSSHRPYDDELGRLVRAALITRIEKQKPSRRNWRRIKLQLQQGSRWRSSHLFSLSLSVATQVALLALLLTVGGLDIRYETALHSDRGKSSNSLSDYVSSSALIMTATSARNDSGALAVPENSDEMRLLKTQSRIRHEASSLPAEPGSPPLFVPPIDVLPHTLSPEGRSLAIERQLAENMFEVLSSLQVGHAGSGMIK